MLKIVASLDLTLSERKGLTICQNFLLSVISFSFNFAKYSFFPFSEGKHSSFFVCYRVLDLGLCLKGLLFPRIYFFFLGACLLTF